ncbi:MAG: DMT family transporter [Alphaproteobacteria bacterium]|nr:DMT family transporter [Alphaproteobacteria bacterium]
MIDSGKLGYIYTVLGVILYSFSDAIMKSAMDIYSVHQVIFLRTFFRFIPILILMFAAKSNPYCSHRKTENIFRAILASCGTYCAMMAYKYAALTDVFVIGGTTAIFVIPLSVWILKEKFNRMNLFAVILGFSGICLAFRPGSGIFQFGILFAVINAIIAAINRVLIKRLAFTDSEFTIISYHNTCLILIALTFGWSEFRWVSLMDILILSLGGIIGAFAQYLITRAFKLSSSSGLASAAYAMLVPNVIIDYFVFSKTPDVYILVGLILISSASLIAFRLQSKLR